MLLKLAAWVPCAEEIIQQSGLVRLHLSNTRNDTDGKIKLLQLVNDFLVNLQVIPVIKVQLLPNINLWSEPRGRGGKDFAVQ